MDVRGVGQASAGYTWAPDTLQEAVRTAVDEFVQAKLEQIQELPVELLSDERLGRELESLGVSSTPDRLVAARALIQEQGQLDPGALNELERSLNSLADHSEPEARAAAFLQARQLPVTKETVALVLNRTQNADLAGTRMATLIDQVATSLGSAKTQDSAPLQAPHQPLQAPSSPSTPQAPASPATPTSTDHASASTPSAPTSSPAAQAAQPPAPPEGFQAAQERPVQTAQSSTPAATPTPAQSAPAAPQLPATESEPPEPAPTPEPPSPAKAQTAAAHAPQAANQTQAQAQVKPAIPIPPQPAIATVAAAKTEAPVLDRLVAPQPVPSPPTTRQELGERLRSFTLPEGPPASAIVAGLKRLVRALQAPESDLSRAIATQDPQAPLDAKSRLSHLATEAVRQTAGDPAAKQLEGEVRFTQLQNATSPSPDERVITIPVWWASGSGEIRVHDQSQGGEKRPGETNRATRVVVDLRTPHLQTVRIDLLLARGQVNCQVAVQDQGVATFLQPHLVDLRAGLEKAGVRVNALGVRTMASEEVDPLDAKGVDFYG